MQLSSNDVHGFKRLSMLIFAFHLNFVSKLCDHKSCYEVASVLVADGPKERNCVIRCVYILMSISKFCIFH